MALKKRDFQKIAQQVQEFLSKLSCEEGTADLRDALNLALLYTQKYYKTLRSRSHSNAFLGSEHRSLSGTLLFTNSCGAVSPVSPACGMQNQFEWKWYNLGSPKLSASLGTSEFSSLSPFLQAAKTGDLEALKTLINGDPETVNSVDGLGRNGLMYTVHENTPEHAECLELILEKGRWDLDHQANDNSTALHVAAHENNTTALKLLLRNKASCSVEDNEGRTALHWAAANPSVDNLKLLLQHGANIRVNDCEGLTPAMWACHFDQLKNLTVLRSALSRVDPCDEAVYEETDLKGRTVVHWAVNKVGSTECLKVLLTKESGLLHDNEQKNVLHTAAEQGVLVACHLALDVCGEECLSMTDSKGRTPLHLAALCGHAEIVMFLLDRGADLSTRDNNGFTAVEIIKHKHLYYCMKVLSLNPQYQKLYLDEINSNENTSITSPHVDNADESSHHKVSPSAPPAFEVLQDEPSLEREEYNQATDKDNNIFFHEVDTPGRRNSDVTSRQQEAPKPIPRRSRKQSAPAQTAPTQIAPAQIAPAQTAPVQIAPAQIASAQIAPAQIAPAQYEDEQKREISSTEAENTIEENQNSEGSSSCNSGKGQEKQAPVRRKSILMRQGGIHEDSAQSDSSKATAFDMRTEDGSVVLVGGIGDLRANTDDFDLNDDILEIDCGNEEEENFGYSGAQLDEGRGSASSVQSDLDHADNCSVSVEPSVSSLGSDNEDRLCNGTPDMNDEVFDCDHNQQLVAPENKINVQAKGIGQSNYPMASPNDSSKEKSHRPPRPRQTHNEPDRQENSFQPELQQTTEKKPKKKKEKKKKIDLPPPVGPPRGVIAPLEPPSIALCPGPSKLGGMDGIVPRPGPWEHANIGLLRRSSPESPRFSAHSPYRSSDEFDVEVYNEREGGFDRPRTPEPPRNSSRDVMTKPLYHPTPPGLRGQGEDRDLYGGSSGPGFGPLTLNHNQAILRNTEMMIRGSPTGKNDPRGIMGNTVPRSKSLQMTAFSLHGGPVPHPPQR